MKYGAGDRSPTGSGSIHYIYRDHPRGVGVGVIAKSGHPRGPTRRRNVCVLRIQSCTRCRAQKHTPNQRPRRGRTRDVYSPPSVAPGGRILLRPYDRVHVGLQKTDVYSPPSVAIGGRMLLRPYPDGRQGSNIFPVPLTRLASGRPDCAIFAIRDRGDLCEQDYSSNSRPPAPPLTKSNDDRPA